VKGPYERLLEEREREEVVRERFELSSCSTWHEKPEGYSYAPPKGWEEHLGPGPYGYATKEEIAQELAEYRHGYERGVRFLARLIRNGASGYASSYLLGHLRRKHPYHYDRFMTKKWSREAAGRGSCARVATCRSWESLVTSATTG
jgi:hypothetical protein